MKAFEVFDRNGDGFLDASELKEGMAKFGAHQPSDAKVKYSQGQT